MNGSGGGGNNGGCMESYGGDGGRAADVPYKKQE